MLEKQKKDIEQKSVEVGEKVKELEIVSQYKSDFLATMSHELRSPLNSMLLLSQNLRDNKSGNMTEDEVKSLSIIYNSGNDLLNLINDILDLSKIEARMVEVQPQKTLINDIVNNIRRDFLHVADDKGLNLRINIADKLPPVIITDKMRFLQIIKNLVSNAIKFTSKGEVTVDFKLAPEDANILENGLHPKGSLMVSITDTGTGIPAEKEKIIFEAFRQVEGGTARRFGGTGLGLSIAKGLANLLEGEIQVNSKVGVGSTFMLFLPFELKAKRVIQKPMEVGNVGKSHLQSRDMDIKIISDDRENIDKESKVILVIEDAREYAELIKSECNIKGMKCLIAFSGEDGLELADKYLPDGIILDLKLPGISGWAVLDSLKDNLRTRHIPVHIISGLDPALDATVKGVIGYLIKPARKEQLQEMISSIENVFNKDIKDLLVVEDDEIQRKHIVQLIGDHDVHVTESSNGKDAIQELSSRKFDCVILDFVLPDMTGLQLLEKLGKDKDIQLPPIIVYTAKDITTKEETQLRQYTNSVIIKGEMADERLLDETALFLHREVSNLSQNKQEMIKFIYDKESAFKEKKILIVDDDMRNTFAISRILQEKGAQTIIAESGNRAMDILDKEMDIELVLMDIMMPGMDGYETMRKIRSKKLFEQLPIIAITAKAMLEDREKCIDAGANDYISKPIEIGRLLTVMRIWLYK